MNNTEYTALDTAIKHAIDGAAILFVGAGISYLSKNNTEDILPSGAALLEILKNDLDLSDAQHPLDRVAGRYVRKLGASSLYDKMIRLLRVTEVDDRLANLYAMNWRRIYTTNYDDAIEVSRKSRRLPSSLTIEDSTERVSEGATIHINGFIERVSPTNIATNLVLTDTSYATNNFGKSPWAQFFSTDIRLCRSLIFIGYSLYDLDIARILIEDQSIKEKTVFIISPNADEIEKDTLSDYGTVFAKGFEFLAERVELVSSTYEQKAKSGVFSAIRELGIGYPKKTINTSNKIYEQLVYGAIPFDEIFSETPAFEEVYYLVKRDQISIAYEQIRNGRWRDTVITGGLASGKTFAAIHLALCYRKDGYRIFWVADSRNLKGDLDSLSNSRDKICVVFDGYRNYIDEIKYYTQQRQNTHALILTERTSTHDLMSSVIESILQDGNVNDILLDDLSDNEVSQFDELVNFTGLWSDIAGLPKNQRIRHVSTNLKGSLYRLLLEIIESRKVQTEIKSLLDPLKHDEQALRFFTTSFIVNVLGYNFWINDWQVFYRIDSIRRLLSEYKEHVSNFILVDHASIKPRSGIMSSYLLRNSTDDAMISDCLSDMYKCAVGNIFNDDEFNRMYVDLSKYSTVEPLFSDNNKLQSLMDYFERIRAYGDTRNNSDYWLQYGIAATIHGNLDVAEVAFRNAYQRERAKTKPNMTRIDNYFSRFEMQKAIQISDAEEAFRIFRSASDRLSKQIFLNNNRHYPFKTGRAFSEIAARHYDEWTDAQQKAFIKMCKDIRLKALKWQKNNKHSHPDVDILISETARIIKNIEKDTNIL